MAKLNIDEINSYVERNISEFHQKRLTRLSELKLQSVLKRKNPYLFKAKNILTAEQLVRTLLDAHLSSQEETIFGEFLEGLAIFICGMVYGGEKSDSEGIDLRFKKGSVIYLVSIKSGPNWGNSQQIRKMEDSFKRATRTLQTNSRIENSNIRCVNGCCYGRDDGNHGFYEKLCGQSFWEFISGNKDLYTEIIEPLGHKAKEANTEFEASYAAIINRFTKEFMDSFCNSDYEIDWRKLVKFNSANN